MQLKAVDEWIIVPTASSVVLQLQYRTVKPFHKLVLGIIYLRIGKKTFTAKEYDDS